MCGTKHLNPFFRLREASEVLNKYEMQGSASYSPWAGSDPPCKIIRPAAPSQIVVIVWHANCTVSGIIFYESAVDGTCYIAYLREYLS